MRRSQTDSPTPTCPRDGWVRAIRNALGMTQAQLSKRMDIARQNVAVLESDELNGNVTMARLARAAAALSWTRPKP